MKIIVSSKILLKEVQIHSKLIEKDAALPVLKNILFIAKNEILTLQSSNIENHLSTHILYDGVSDGQFIAPAEPLCEFLELLPDMPLTLFYEKEKLEIRSEFGVYKIKCREKINDFPVVPQIEKSTLTEIIFEGFINGIIKTKPMVSNDDMRPALCGINCVFSQNDITFYSTDAHKLTKYKINIPTGINGSFILRKKTASILSTLFDFYDYWKEDAKINIEFNSINILFSNEKFKFTGRLTDGKYPNCDAVFPKESEFKITLDERFRQAVARFSMLAESPDYRMDCLMEPGRITLSTEDISGEISYKETISCEGGQNFEIAFNAKFMNRILNTFEGDIHLEFTTPNRAIKITPNQNEGEEHTMLLMPICP